MNSLLKTVTRQRRGCDLNPGPSAPESSTLTTPLPSHPVAICTLCQTEWTYTTSQTNKILLADLATLAVLAVDD